jgi:hypothetical protein
MRSTRCPEKLRVWMDGVCSERLVFVVRCILKSKLYDGESHATRRLGVPEEFPRG